MKWYVSLVLLAVFCLCVRAEDDFQVFRDTQGRDIKLKLVRCAPERDKVTVEREDGCRLTVTISGFCESDQAYIKRWFQANELLSESNLRIKCREEVVHVRGEAIYEYEVIGSVGRAELVGNTVFEQIAYFVTFENRGTQPIEDVRLKYRIYYEQIPEDMKEPVQEVLADVERLDALHPRKEMVFETMSVMIVNQEAPLHYNPVKGEVHGLRGRLIVNMVGGGNVVREFQYPSSLSAEDFPWK